MPFLEFCATFGILGLFPVGESLPVVLRGPCDIKDPTQASCMPNINCILLNDLCALYKFLPCIWLRFFLIREARMNDLGLKTRNIASWENIIPAN